MASGDDNLVMEGASTTAQMPPPRERGWGTAATVAAAVAAGADIVRVHDVKEMAQVVRVADGIWRRG